MALKPVGRASGMRSRPLPRVGLRYCMAIVRNTMKSLYGGIRKLIFLVNWLYVFALVLTYYSLKLFWNNMWICYVILVFFVLTLVVFLYSNLKRLNQQNNMSMSQEGGFCENQPLNLEKFAFVDPMNWQRELTELNRKNPELDRLLYPESMLISSIVDQIIGLIINSFIKPWYKSIHSSKSEDLFIDEVKITIKQVVFNLYLKLSVLDFPNLMVLRLIPVITDHFNNFVSAKVAVRKKYLAKGEEKLSITDEKQINLLISKFYKHGKLHPTVNLFRDNVQFSSLSQKTHLRNKLNKILPLLLNKHETACLPVMLLIREIVINCVFLPLVNMVVEPDFWNQMVVDKIGKTLKDRTKVIQLRAELQKHSQNASKPKKTAASKPRDSTADTLANSSQEHALFEFKLTKSTSQSAFEKYLKKINKCNSIVDLRQLKFYISLQLQKTLRNEEYNTAVKQYSLEKKNKELYDRYKILIKRLQIIQLTLTNRINNLNFENQTISLDSLSIHSSRPMADVSLATILNDPSLLSYYMEYMDQNHTTLLLQFWLVVNGIKDPLEDSLLINTDDIYMEDGASPDNQTSEADINQNINFANDIKLIFNNYFNSKLIIENNKVVYENVETFVKQYDAYLALQSAQKEQLNDYELYKEKYQLNKLFTKARKSILILQANIFKHMENDLANFKKSDSFLKLLASEHGLVPDQNENKGLGLKYDESNGDPLANYHIQEDSTQNNIKMVLSPGESIFDSDEAVSYDVINAVEHALNEIIDNNNEYKNYDVTRLKRDILTNSSNVEEDNKVSNLFGQSSSLFKGDFNWFGGGVNASDNSSSSSSNHNNTNSSSNGSNNNNPNSNTNSTNNNSNATTSKTVLFDSQDEIEEIDDMDSVISEIINSETLGEYESEVRLAAPGDLSLTEEIDKLSNDIDSLNNQVRIIQPLLRKAELTNNVGELRILRKANISLQREVQLKELQRQQYIVQENDNSLYGKSRVNIQSYITCNDEETGREYTSYIIEVQKITVDDKDTQTVLAGWIVARRFSQFYMLNRYLKSVYPKVKLLNFPKKNIILLNLAQQKLLVETRRRLLQEYLEQLLEMPDVCKSKIFRLFLSSQDFTNGIFAKTAKASDQTARNLDKTIRNSELISKKKDAVAYRTIEDVTAKLYNGITNGIEYLNGSMVFANSNAQSAGLNGLAKLTRDNDATASNAAGKNDTELQNELNSYDDDKTTFVKPICDLLLSIFALNKSNSWLRGRAILMVLQQLLGSTIEKKIRVYMSVIKSENKVIDLLNIFKDIIWPNNTFFLSTREEKKPRTELEKQNTENEARTLLEIIITDITSKIVGLNNSKFAAAECHNMLQNDILNTHLAYTLLDEIFDAVLGIALENVK